MKQTYEEAVLKIVMWWSDKSFRTPLNQNNGETGMLHTLMNSTSTNANSRTTPQQIKLFEEKLGELLMNASERERNLDVDYHPCSLLAQAADFAKIETAVFPCKSFTRIDKDNRAFAKYQYGNQPIEI